MSPNPNARDTGAATPASKAGTSLPSRSSNTIHFCLACGSEAKKRCNKCLKLGLMAFYCSRACQLGDWNSHKRTCGKNATKSPDDGWMRLFNADDKGHEAELRALIEAGGTDLNKAMKEGLTLLHVAVLRGHQGVVRVLIEAGADIDKTENGSITPLYVATEKGHEAEVRALIQTGADVNKANDVDAAIVTILKDAGEVLPPK